MLRHIGLLLGIVLLTIVLPLDSKAIAGEKKPPARNWRSVNDFLYAIDYNNLKAIGKTKFDLVILDADNFEADDLRYSPKALAELKRSKGGNKLLLAYICIGEAESFRAYWKPAWDKTKDGKPDKGAPNWLGRNIYPEWEGSYVVKYWDVEWQKLVLRRIDGIIAAGFDGIYLDRVDSYEYWMPGGRSKANYKEAERKMIDFVKLIARHARKKGRADFGVFPQGGFGLAEHADYVAVTTGIGNEDNWFNGNSRNGQGETKEILKYLDTFKKAGKLVLVTDYVTRTPLIYDFYSNARSKGYIPYATVRPLNKLTVNQGFAPD